MTEIREIATGLRFPEGPIAMPDGSVLLVEIERGTLTRVSADGKVEYVAKTGGGPNGAAMGPDGKVYICNNGGFQWSEVQGLLFPGAQPDDYTSGSIQRVDLATGEVETLYTEADGPEGKVRLCGPNDLVFDGHGGFWFTDHGKHRARDEDRTGAYYAKADGSLCKEVIFPLQGPNGIGLSPDGKKLYVAETWTGRVWSFDVTAPGELGKGDAIFGHGGYLLAGLPGVQLLDSLAVDSEGNVCVATILNPGITVVSPTGDVSHVPIPGDPLVTNICFGGPDLKTAYVTVSGTGKLLSMPWHCAGAPLHHLN